VDVIGSQAGGAPEAAQPQRPRNEEPIMAVVFTAPAGGPRGSWPADEKAAEIRAAGGEAEVKMDMSTDSFRVHVPQR
jgi:hypothetical protein